VIEYDTIEKFQGFVKTHRLAMDFDAGLIEWLLIEALEATREQVVIAH
jgi:hypothetical protein